jgi:hypothetical protein
MEESEIEGTSRRVLVRRIENVVGVAFPSWKIVRIVRVVDSWKGLDGGSDGNGGKGFFGEKRIMSSMRPNPGLIRRDERVV